MNTRNVKYIEIPLKSSERSGRDTSCISGFAETNGFSNCGVLARTFRQIVCGGLLSILLGCTAVPPLIAPPVGWSPPPSPKVLIVPPDVRAAVLTTGGIEQERVDWTRAAQSNVQEAIIKEFSRRGLDAVNYEVVPGSIRWNREDASIIKLHEAVGTSIQFSGLLPTQFKKRPHLEYSLGNSVQKLKRVYDADFALFLHSKTTHASGGRVAVSILAAVGGVSVPLGFQTAFVSLVDLAEGRIIWYRNPYIQGTAFSADIRKPEGASLFVTRLLEELPL